MINSFMGATPTIAPGVRLAETAAVVGDVVLSGGVSVWYGAAVRGDNGPIRIGENTNIQDNAVLHASPDDPLTIGADVTVGHGAIVHGCTVEDGALIGMGAILLNGCIVGAESMVAAGALVTGGTVIPPRHLAIGSPAKVIRPLREEELSLNRAGVEEYLHLSKQLEEHL